MRSHVIRHFLRLGPNPRFRHLGSIFPKKKIRYAYGESRECVPSAYAYQVDTIFVTGFAKLKTVRIFFQLSKPCHMSAFYDLFSLFTRVNLLKYIS